MARLAPKAQPTLSQGGDLLSGHRYIRRHKGQDKIKDGGSGVHDAAGQTHDWGAVPVIAQQEHGAGQHRGTVGDNFCPACLNAAGGVVIWVHAHTAGAEDYIGSGAPGLPYSARHILHPVAGVGDRNGPDAVGGKLFLDDRSKGILNDTV